jgi:hypothetical protein
LKGRILVALAAAFALAAPSALASPPLSWTSPIAISPSGSPYTDATTCSGSTTGTLFTGTEVEPWIATNPANTGNSIAVWQQDRYSNGGANSLRAAYSAGGTWADPTNQPAFSKCSGGELTGVNNFERASDPWVAIASDGHVAYFMALAFNESASLESAMTVSRSFAKDGVVGSEWESTPTVLKYDPNFHVLNDKNSLTTDRSDPNTAYAIWDRLVFPNERSKGKSYENAGAYYGPTWFTRTTDSGGHWDTARKIWDPAQERGDSGRNDQSIGNQIVQTGTGRLVDIFTWINNDNAGGSKGGNRKGYKIAAITSGNGGQTWSDHAVVVSHFIPGVVVDPTTGAPVRTGDIIPEIAYDPTPGSNTVYAVWQGASASSRSSIYFSRSIDGGDNWSDPVIINKVTTTEAFTPAIRVQRKNGTTRIAVNYYDFRNDTDSAPLSTDYWSTESTDGGGTWVENPDSISGTFDQRTAAIARGYFLGDYSGLSAADTTDVFHAVFGESKGTNPDQHASDIEESDGD